MNKPFKPLVLAGFLLSLLIILALTLTTLAAPNTDTAPTSSQAPAVPNQIIQGARPLDEVDVLTLPRVDNAALFREDAQAAPGTPNRFAIPFPVAVTPQDRGDWETLSDGRLLWQLRILSPDAYSLNLGFGQFALPPDAQLTLYTPDYQTIRGPFTAADNDAHGQLWTPIMPGKEVVLQLVMPSAQQAELKLALTAVNHGYTDFKRSNSPESGSCNVDVVCSEGDAWRDQIRSSGVYTVNGTWTCSGALVNNTAQDLTPYFLTADHCSVSSSNAASVVVYWNYENSTCRPVGSAESGGPGDGSLAQYNTGAIFRADYAPSDFTLIELDDPVDPAVNAYWSGWDANAGDYPSAVAIHHPNTDEKRISFEYDATSTTSYLNPAVPGDGTHIRIADWDLGTTEPGSSGSPLYNPAQRIIGQLHGGYAACGNNLSDWYGRLSVSWMGGGTAATRLSNWLDPLNTGTLVFDGRAQDTTPDFNLAAMPASQNICVGNSALYSVDVLQLNGFIDPVTLSASGQPAGTTASFSANPISPPGSSTLSIGNTSGAAPGSYALNITGVSPTSTHTTTVQLNVFDSLGVTPSLVSPANGATNVPIQPTLAWNTVGGAATYFVEVATDSNFNNVIESATVNGASYAVAGPLDGSTLYFWRVTAVNPCGSSTPSTPFSFVTASVDLVCNSDPITIPDSGSGTPYPSTINVSGYSGEVLDVNVRLLSLSHTYPDDLDVLLVGPQGQNLLVMSDTGGGDDVSQLDLTLDDEAATALPDSTALSSGTYRPTNVGLGDNFPAPAPFPSTATALSTFDSTDPNGEWSLYVMDDAGSDSGSVAGGWCLEMATAVPNEAAVSLSKTVGTEAGVCATTTEIAVTEGTAVYYCYTIANTGSVSLPYHDLVDDQLGTILTGFAYNLAPGASIDTVAAGLTISATITTTTTNTAVWTAYDNATAMASSTAAATVNAVPLQHLYLPAVMKP